MLDADVHNREGGFPHADMVRGVGKQVVFVNILYGRR